MLLTGCISPVANEIKNKAGNKLGLVVALLYLYRLNLVVYMIFTKYKKNTS